MTERAVPFHCPYCGDEDLRPSEEETSRGAGAAWECRACSRAFRLKFLGLLAPGAAGSAPSPSASPSRSPSPSAVPSASDGGTP
ncbi:hypothetical protein [Streptomyces sp. MspMP-M5]|uniref:hypothetical protein n=1 Tax=unclassified Streptomyces TaxID=2593676 RepID=UPI0003A7E3FF|nr:hypothetical protein [Streptomyces sp. MspMP-M5]MYT28042.1 hypothetical protein [Streptomyces sp. SID8354]